MAHPTAPPPYYLEQTNEVALYTAAYVARLPVMLKGPTGCGKSRFVEYMVSVGIPVSERILNEFVAGIRLVESERWSPRLTNFCAV